MVKLYKRYFNCHFPGCPDRAGYNYKLSTRAYYCKNHKLKYMCYKYNKRCEHEFCLKTARYPFPGSKKYCKQHYNVNMSEQINNVLDLINYEDLIKLEIIFEC